MFIKQPLNTSNTNVTFILIIYIHLSHLCTAFKDTFYSGIHLLKDLCVSVVKLSLHLMFSLMQNNDYAVKFRFKCSVSQNVSS